MSAPAAEADHLFGAPGQWMPLNKRSIEFVLKSMRSWQPISVDAIFEDLGDVLGNQAPPLDRFEELAERLRGHLMQLLNILVANPRNEDSPATQALVERARTQRSAELPGDDRKALGHLRRLSWITLEVLELLIDTKQIKEAD